MCSSVIGRKIGTWQQCMAGCDVCPGFSRKTLQIEVSLQGLHLGDLNDLKRKAQLMIVPI